MTGLASSSLVDDALSQWDVHAHDCLGSTNDEARRLARCGARHGTTVWARIQTSGRGRRGRTWSSPAGNLHMSVILHDLGRPASQLGFVASLAVADAIDGICGWDRTRLKWPNDILLDGKKTAGILLEAEPMAEGNAVVVGIGLNLLHFPTVAEYPATSLHVHGVDATPETVLRVILRTLDSRFNQWRNQDFSDILKHWLTRGHLIGERLHVSTSGERYTATFVGLDNDGSLLAQIDKEVRRFAAADILSG